MKIVCIDKFLWNEFIEAAEHTQPAANFSVLFISDMYRDYLFFNIFRYANTDLEVTILLVFKQLLSIINDSRVRVTVFVCLSLYIGIHIRLFHI